MINFTEQQIKAALARGANWNSSNGNASFNEPLKNLTYRIRWGEP